MSNSQSANLYIILRTAPFLGYGTIGSLRRRDTARRRFRTCRWRRLHEKSKKSSDEIPLPCKPAGPESTNLCKSKTNKPPKKRDETIITLFITENRAAPTNVAFIKTGLADIFDLLRGVLPKRTTRTKAEEIQRVLNIRAALADRQRRLNNIRLGSGGHFID
ncbi:MAG: hypothetical protein OSB82_14445 [Alphaproteobacteria bacterium]|nr:hypothetical protein [Alphaproteobacteria bacterium]